MPPRKMKKGARRPRRATRKPISKGLAGVPEQASMTEVISYKTPSGGAYSCNNSYRFFNCSLALTKRAQVVAQGYQEFRIRRITAVFKTTYDTFVAGTGAAAPQLYYMVDKRGAVPLNFTIDTISQMGATPHRFDDKLKAIKYTPAVLQSSLTDPTALTSQLAAAQISPWLPTNSAPLSSTAWTPSDVDHFGLVWQAYIPSGSTQCLYDVDFLLDFEFRKARFNQPDGPIPRALNWNEAPPEAAPIVQI